MSLSIVPFEPSHFESLKGNLQDAQAWLRLDGDYGEKLLMFGKAFTGIDTKTGDVVGCAGFMTLWENRAKVWAVLSRKAGRHFPAIHKAVMREMEAYPARRIEAEVTSAFPEGHRWVKMLGFSHEGTMRAYTPGGNDCDLYAIIKEI